MLIIAEFLVFLVKRFYGFRGMFHSFVALTSFQCYETVEAETWPSAMMLNQQIGWQIRVSGIL